MTKANAPLLFATDRSLDVQRAEFSRSRFLAMPLAGTVAWAWILVGGLFLPTFWATLNVFFATGAIAGLGMLFSRWTGENFLDKTRPKNAFDALFFCAVAQALLAYAIAIPFFQTDYRSLPMTVGILTGAMWLPFSWIVQHWIGLFHAIVRTLLLVALWYWVPDRLLLAAPIVIIAVYLATIVVLELRWRALRDAGGR